MKEVGAASLLIAATALMGCLASAPSATDTATRDVDIVTDARSCTEIFLGVLVDPEHARRFLPAGFEPADAAAALGSAVPAGRALVAINAVECDGSAIESGPLGFAELIVAVERPEIESARVEEAARNAYLLHGFTSAARLIEETAHTGFSLGIADVDAAFAVAAGDAHVAGRGRIADAAGELARFDIVAAPVGPESSSANQFQVTPSGLAAHELSWRSAEVAVGSATCSLRAGSLVAEALGTTGCADVPTIGALMGPFDLDGRFRHFAAPGETRGDR